MKSVTCAISFDGLVELSLNRLSFKLRPTTHESSSSSSSKGADSVIEQYRIAGHLVTRGHFRSRDKDGDHTIRFAIVKNLMTHGNCTALCFYRTGVIDYQILHCGNRIFNFFCCCDLDLDPMTFIYVVRDLGVYLDSEFSLKQHISKVANSCFITCYGYARNAIRRGMML